MIMIHFCYNSITYAIKCYTNDVYKKINNLELADKKVSDIYRPFKNTKLNTDFL